MVKASARCVIVETYAVFCCVVNALCFVLPNTTDSPSTEATEWTTSDVRVRSTTEVFSFGPCSSDAKCRNGADSGSCPQNGTCDCSLNGSRMQYFWGAACDKLNLEVTSRLATRRSLVITWQADPGLKGKYYFVFRKTSSHQHDIHIESLNQINNRSVRLANLEAGVTDYVVCLLDQELAATVYATRNISRLSTQYKDCVLVKARSSTVWNQQLAFYLICAGMGLVLLIIFFVGCVKESLDKRNYHLFDTGLEHEEHEVDDVQDISSDKDDVDNTCALDDSNDLDTAMETV